MTEKKFSLVLGIQEAGKDTRQETFSQESVTIGAGDTADLKIEGAKVSDVHAMFDASRGTELFIMDLGSSSGTFVNDKKVNKQKLKAGDSITIGDVGIQVEAFGDVQPEVEAVAAVEPEAEAVEATPVEEPAPVEEALVEETVEEEVQAAPVEDAPAEAEEAEEVEAAPAEDAKAAEEALKAEEEAKAAEAAAEEAKAAEIAAEEAKALEAKQAAFEAKKARAKKKNITYDLDVIPKEHKAPSSREKILETREVLWGDTLLNILHTPRPININMGEKKSCTFFVSNEWFDGETFTVAQPSGSGGFALNFNDKMEGLVEENGSSWSFKEMAKKNKAADKGGYRQFDLTPGMAVTYNLGELKYYFRFVEPEKLAPVPFTKRIDYPITSLFVILFLIYTLTTVYLKSLPAPEVADILDAPDRFAKLILEPVEMEEPPPPEEEKLAIESAEKSIGEEGKIGEEESVIDKSEGDARKRLEDEKVANSSGILGALDQGMESMDRLFGGGGLGAGLDKTLGMLEGISGLDMRGAGGLGSRGSGLGGGGTAIGIGGLGTKGRGGRGGRSQYGIGAAGNLNKKKSNINIKTGNPTITGALDKSIIARIIKKHYSQIRYCYQKELNKNPKLYGKITIKFTISGRGTVSSSAVAVTTMKNMQVESCVAKTIKRIIFPQPKGGGIVVVTYPFIFKAEGS